MSERVVPAALVHRWRTTSLCDFYDLSARVEAVCADVAALLQQEVSLHSAEDLLPIAEHLKIVSELWEDMSRDTNLRLRPTVTLYAREGYDWGDTVNSEYAED